MSGIAEKDALDLHGEIWSDGKEFFIVIKTAWKRGKFPSEKFEKGPYATQELAAGAMKKALAEIGMALTPTENSN